MDSTANGPAFEAVPEQLKRLHGWMTSGGGVDGKAPTDEKGYDVSRAVADVWRTFEVVVKEDRQRECGIGWVIQPGYVVFDLDDALDENGELRKQFKAFVEDVDTYIEKSRSGRGLHAFVKSSVVPEKDKMSYVYPDGSKVEILAPGWYVRMTGEVYASKPSKVSDCTATVGKTLQKIREAKGEAAGDNSHGGEPGLGNSLTDEEVLERASSARNGEKFRFLMAGDISAHAGDDSAADLALCNILRFWTGGDPEQMDRLFRRSGLMREKWDERRGESTYGQRTVALALQTREFYTDRLPQQEAAAEITKEPTGLCGRQLIGKAITEGIEPPTMLIDGILYEGMVHAWHGEPGAGKTLLALWAALEVMKRGRAVLYLDEEGSLQTIAERVEGMGADPRSLDELFHYYQSPGVTLSQESVGSMLHTAREVAPALVVFDSWVDFLALNGLNENDSVDVTRWVLSVAYPLRELGAAILLLDHVNKDGSGKGGRGSSAKLAKLDAGYKLAKNEDYDRQGMGKVTLTRDKDRPAALERSVSFAVGGDGSGRIRVVPNAEIRHAADEPTPNERKMLDVLAPGMRHGEWQKATGLARSSFNSGRERLLKMGLVQKHDGLYFPASVTDMTEAA